LNSRIRASSLRDAGRALTARQWWQVGGLALLLVLLWSIGLWRAWPMTALLGGTIVLLVGVMIALLVERARATRHAEELERSLHGHAETRALAFDQSGKRSSIRSSRNSSLRWNR
jgi:hypothetical protein